MFYFFKDPMFQIFFAIALMVGGVFTYVIGPLYPAIGALVYLGMFLYDRYTNKYSELKVFIEHDRYIFGSVLWILFFPIILQEFFSNR